MAPPVQSHLPGSKSDAIEKSNFLIRCGMQTLGAYIPTFGCRPELEAHPILQISTTKKVCHANEFSSFNNSLFMIELAGISSPLIIILLSSLFDRLCFRFILSEAASMVSDLTAKPDLR